MNVGYIGLGAMGVPMARNLAQAGLLTSVWNRTLDKAKRLAKDLNVHCADSPADLAQRVDVVLTCVSSDQDLLAVIEALSEGLRSGQVIVDHSTVSSDTARHAAGLVRQRGGEFLDAPVSGGVEGARNASLVVMVGGSRIVLDQVSPVLQAISNRVVLMGDVGAGQATKAVNQIMAAGINQAVTEALAFGEAQGLDMNKVIQVVSGGAAGNWFLEKRGVSMLSRSFTPGFKVALHHKDLKICMEMAGKLDLPIRLAEMTLRDYADLMAQGYGEEDISALYRLKRQLAGKVDV